MKVSIKSNTIKISSQNFTRYYVGYDLVEAYSKFEQERKELTK